jgi:hypothetical protein
LPMCVGTRILAQGDWRTRYVTLASSFPSNWPSMEKKESRFWWYCWKPRKARAV